jgi:alpha/beta superfamily hydrolase
MNAAFHRLTFMEISSSSPSIQSAPSIQSIDLAGPAGLLEALLNTGSPDVPFTALVCHPHPMGGGTMHNKVVYHAMKALHSLGLPVLRFNFRGTGRSEGAHDDGRGEQEDVRSALDWLDEKFHKPILFTGFSFGANVGMRACCSDPRVQGLIALGLPVSAEGRSYTYKYLPQCTQPKLFISGDKDQYGPVAEVEAIVAKAPEPKRLVWIAGGDHFFLGKLDLVQAAIIDWVTQTLLDGVR